MRMDDVTRQDAAVLADDPHGEEAEQPTSALLRELADGWDGERISIAQMVHAFGARGYGLLLFIFALPNMIPNPFPGVSSLLGLPLLLLAWQMARGSPEPYLPRPAGRTHAFHASSCARSCTRPDPGSRGWRNTCGRAPAGSPRRAASG